MKILLHYFYFLVNIESCILSHCSLRKARPIATANSGPVAFKTFSKKTGALILENGSDMTTSVVKLPTAASLKPFNNDPPPVNIILLIVLLFFFSYPNITLFVSDKT